MDIITLLKTHEGVRYRVYKDSLGIPTVGVGLNLTRADSRARLQAVGADYDAVLAGTQALSDAQVDALLQEDVSACIADLKTIFSNWDTLPVAAQDVSIDLRFNLGGHGFRGFPHFIACIESGDWSGAAEQLMGTKWAKQVGVRATEDEALLNSI